MNRYSNICSVLAFAIAAAIFGGATPGPVTPQTTPAAATTSRPASNLLTEDPTKPSPVRSNAAGATNGGWINRHNGFVATAKAAESGANPIDLYMEGDSITDFWKTRFAANWNRTIAQWHAADFGISGDRTQNLLYRLENGELDGVNPKVIVLNIGTNNLAFNAVYGANSVEDTVKGIRTVLDTLQKKAPKARILLIGIMPRNDVGKTPPEIWQNILKTNQAIAKFADDKTIKFIDLNDKLADKDGKLFPGVMGADNLHPAEKGYQIWFDAMKPALTEWLGTPAAATTSAPAK